MNLPSRIHSPAFGMIRAWRRRRPWRKVRARRRRCVGWHAARPARVLTFRTLFPRSHARIRRVNTGPIAAHILLSRLTITPFSEMGATIPFRLQHPDVRPRKHAVRPRAWKANVSREVSACDQFCIYDYLISIPFWMPGRKVRKKSSLLFLLSLLRRECSTVESTILNGKLRCWIALKTRCDPQTIASCGGAAAQAKKRWNAMLWR